MIRKKLRDYSKEQSDLQEVVEKYRRYKEVTDSIKESKTILEDESDEDLREWHVKNLMSLSLKLRRLNKK